MKLMITVNDYEFKVDVKNIYEEIQGYIESAAAKGKRKIAICFLDDSFKFSHIKPIVERLSKNTGLSIHAEGGSIIRPHLYIEF